MAKGQHRQRGRKTLRGTHVVITIWNIDSNEITNDRKLVAYPSNSDRSSLHFDVIQVTQRDSQPVNQAYVREAVFPTRLVRRPL